MNTVLYLTQRLLQYNTVNPPGFESDISKYIAEKLEESGLKVGVQTFGPGRENVCALLEGSDAELEPLVFTGHMDTVPLGDTPWKRSPFDGEIENGKLYGRGSSDMKAGVAAMMEAVCGFARKGAKRPTRGISLILTGGEETGCHGARHFMLAPGPYLKSESAIVVGEPTSNRCAVGHKGALFLKATSTGVTAHSSMPEKGKNAIYETARAICRLADNHVEAPQDDVLGAVTQNVGMVSGGLNINSVPDLASFTIDIRSNSCVTHNDLLVQLQKRLGNDVKVEVMADLPAVLTACDDPFVFLASEIAANVTGESSDRAPYALPFFTDASVFQGDAGRPTIILGPGEPEMAHQTDEYCLIERLGQAFNIYTEIIDRWCC